VRSAGPTYTPSKNGVSDGAFGRVIVVVGVAGEEGAVGVAGEEGVGGVAGEEGAVGVAGEEGVGDGELTVAPFETASTKKYIGLKTSERSCHVERRAED
jgi:hypothetical protein